MGLLGGRPLSKSVVAPAEHSDLTIAPGLLHDPVDNGPRIIPVVFIGDRLTRAVPFPTGQPNNAREPVRRCELGAVWNRLRGIDRELQRGRQAASTCAWT